jgi:uncharacterized iron-regulated membrane protein
MRAFFLVIHRWVGLAIALFLLVAGLTGAVISWDHEVDEWLNADIMHTPGRGLLKAPLELAAVVQASDPRVEVSYMTLGLEEGHAALFLVRPRTDPVTGQQYELDYDSTFVDPVTGEITGHRDSGSIALSKRNLMAWLRHLHESLHMPAFAGSDRWGYWLMGGVALVWFFDTFVAAYLTLPKKAASGSRSGGNGQQPTRSWFSRWKPSWLIRWGAGGYKLNFDLHRAGGLWAGAIILIIAFTSFSLNLYNEVFYPVMSKVSKTTPGPYQTLEPAPYGTFIEPKISFAEAIEIATKEGEKLNYEYPPAGIWYGGDYPFYNVSFFDPSDEFGSLGMGLSNIYVSSETGEVIGTYQPWHGTAADVFLQLQLPLHSGRILGLPGRILMSLMGLIVVILSITGIVIWEKKRRARRHVARSSVVGLMGEA